MKVLGLMSGTSMDGVDCCYAEIKINKNFDLQYEIIDFILFPFPATLRESINNLIGGEKGKNINEVHNELGKFFVKCCVKTLNNRLIDLISIHGQTIHHIDGQITKQIGNPKYLNIFFQVPVIYEFRKKDIELNGKGAPLVPFLDWLLYKNNNEDTIALNLGGISNLTYIPTTGHRNKVLGFDTGPGMSLIDEYVKLTWNNDMDYDAKHSINGKINHNLLDELLKEKFITQNPPKSTSREDFEKLFLIEKIEKFQKISYNDFIRTLVNFTAITIKINIDMFLNVSKDCRLIISGGGANHPLLIEDLKKNIKIKSLEILNNENLNVNSKESLLMAVLGYSCYHNIPNNMISVTGAKELAVYGEIYE